MGRAIIAAINPAAKSSVQVHVKQREMAISSGGLRWWRESQKMLLRKMLFKLCLEGGVESPSGGKAHGEVQSYASMALWGREVASSFGSQRKWWWYPLGGPGLSVKNSDSGSQSSNPGLGL